MEHDAATRHDLLTYQEKLAITRRALQGARLVDLAREHGVSTGPIQQAIHAMCRAAHRPLYEQLVSRCGQPLAWFRSRKDVFLALLPPQIRTIDDMPPCI